MQRFLRNSHIRLRSSVTDGGGENKRGIMEKRKIAHEIDLYGEDHALDANFAREGR